MIRAAVFCFAASAAAAACSVASASALVVPVAPGGAEPGRMAVALPGAAVEHAAASTSLMRLLLLRQIRAGSQAIQVEPAGWRYVGLDTAAAPHVTTLGILPHGAAGDFFDTQREVVVVAGTLTALTWISLLL